jgi:hypothetical protein
MRSIFTGAGDRTNVEESLYRAIVAKARVLQYGKKRSGYLERIDGPHPSAYLPRNSRSRRLPDASAAKSPLLRGFSPCPNTAQEPPPMAATWPAPVDFGAPRA